MSCGTVRKFPLQWGVQLALLVGVVVAEAVVDDKLAAVARVVRLDVWDGV